MRKSAVVITAIAMFMPVPAIFIFTGVFLLGFTGGISLLAAGAVVLVPFGIAVHLSPYGKLAKRWMWTCVAISVLILLYAASLMPESLPNRPFSSVRSH
jgi:hypothetical protein